ncbi:tetratricopeptide repeat protein [Chryseobacterium sp. 52]|uniref:tetratricopeptide repeat protein n=1 Tax=Chryseobacterium sp. 52 TaxID=2035213 RepID=UPI000C19985D|nr:LuxR C-terminal-related transcriptional regulator [Chryseobacterium sp. 52]PIF47198.1 tetratricopeptide repeat protein [Chryseobacterium sp. 52]
MAKKIFVFLFSLSIFFSSFSHAQNLTDDQLKRIIYDIEIIPANDKDILNIQNIIKKCDACEGIGYLKIAKIYAKNNNQAKALEYIEKINSRQLITADAGLEDFFSLKCLQSGIYRSSGEFVKALDELNELSAEPRIRNYPYYTYFILLLRGSINISMENKAESLRYFREAYKISKSCREKKNLDKIPGRKQQFQIEDSYKSTAYLAVAYVDMDKPDSARIYMKEALRDVDHLDDVRNADIKYTTYHVAGSVYMVDKDYQKAQTYYLMSKKVAEKYLPRYDMKLAIYTALLELYEREGRKDSINYYLKEIVELQKNNKKKDIGVNTSIDIGDRKQMQNLEINNKRLIYTLVIILVIGAVLIYFTFFFYRKYKERSLSKIDIPLHDFTRKEQYNESFKEVVLLAKENKPEFLTRFNQLFSEFSARILSVNDTVQSSELRFCAYLYLNFSTKDIAEYTYISVRTVQTKKYKLRKKLNIPGDVDIYVWLDNLLK